MLCRKNSIRSHSGSEPVYLNVYDLTSINGCAYWLGLGVFHSGVEVHGVEYAFGGHEHLTTGIFEEEPKECDGFKFRKSILIGWTEMNLIEVSVLMEELSEEYRGIAYNLITKNCNHFCNDVCVRLTGNSIPRWVNRLARIGLFCNCIIPVSLINSPKVGHHRIEEDNKKKLRSKSKRLTFTSSSSTSSLNVNVTRSISRSRSRSRSRCSLFPSSPVIFGHTST